MASDVLTQLQEGLCRTADANATVRQLTQRVQGSLMPWMPDFPAELPVVNYVVQSLVPRVGGVTAAVSLTAWARDAVAAQAVLAAVIAAFSQPALFAVGCDAVVLDEIRREIPSEEKTDPARADADLTVFFTPA